VITLFHLGKRISRLKSLQSLKPLLSEKDFALCIRQTSAGTEAKLKRNCAAILLTIHSQVACDCNTLDAALSWRSASVPQKPAVPTVAV
jgi:hypothetical protein